MKYSLHNLLAFREMCYWIWVHSATTTILVYIHHNIQWVNHRMRWLVNGCYWFQANEAINGELYYKFHERGGKSSVYHLYIYIYTHDKSVTNVLSSVYERYQFFVLKYTPVTRNHLSNEPGTSSMESRERPLPVHLYSYTFFLYQFYSRSDLANLVTWTYLDTAW